MSAISFTRNVALLFDEMKIKAGLVFRKDGSLVGFVDISDINTALKSLETNIDEDSSQLATHMLTLMVRGIFTHISFPLASFPTKGLYLYGIL